jgi:hypothetical protein
VTFSGSSDVNLGCGVATNSTGPEAIKVNGNPDVIASPIGAVGGVPPASSFAGTPVMIPYGPPQQDPFGYLGDPVVPANCNAELKVGTQDDITIDPGCYRGMDVKGKLTLRPGTYTIDGGTLSFGSQAEVRGTGVTFVLTSSNAVSNPSSIATWDMNGGAYMNLSAPTSGTYSGVLFYQDRRAPLTNSHINGNSSSVLDGAFYLPSHELTFNGNTGMTVQCMRLVARRVHFSGNSNVVNTCPPGAPIRGFEGIMVRLVG